MQGARTSIFRRLGSIGHLCRVAAARYGESRVAVALRLVALYRLQGFRPGEALASGLVDPRISKEALGACFTKSELQGLQDRLNPTDLIPLTEDKGLFDAHCVARGIPVPTQFAILGRATGERPPEPTLTSCDEWLREVVPRLPGTFITKPALGVYGEGVTAWTRVDSGFSDHTQRRYSARGIYDLCCADSKYDRFLVQERLTNHPSLLALTGATTLQTLRLATLVDAEDEARVLYAVWKVVVGGNDGVTDNFCFGLSGNMFANVTLADGALGAALGPEPDGVGLRPLPIHPVTGASLEGFRLPDWDAVIELALRSARLFLPLRTIGWDIGMTPGGPVIVEANRWWDPPNGAVLGQAAPGGGPHDMIVGASLLRAAAQRAGRP
jgi:Sugar-transfer associated ATP-grasp